MFSLNRISFIIMLIVPTIMGAFADILDDVKIIPEVEITSSKVRKIKVTNNCYLDIYVAICWHDSETSDWGCACWATIDGNSSKYITRDGSYLTTDYSYAYFYAKTLYGSYVWSGYGKIGSKYGTCKGDKYNFYKQSDSDNNYVIEPAVHCDSRRALRGPNSKVSEAYDSMTNVHS